MIYRRSDPAHSAAFPGAQLERRSFDGSLALQAQGPYVAGGLDPWRDRMDAQLIRRLNRGPVDPTAVPTAFRCVDLIASAASQLPIHAYRGTARLDPVPAVLRRPDPSLRRQSWVYRAVVDMLAGNAFALRQLVEGGRASVLRLLPAGEVSVSWDERRLNPVYRWRGQVIPAPELVHVPWYERAGQLLGLGPLSAARVLIEGQTTADEMATDLYRDGALPAGVLSHPLALDQETADDYLARFEDRHNNGRRRPALLTGGVSYQALAPSARDLQFIEARQWGAGDIARAFGVPFSMLGLPIPGANLTYQNRHDVKLDFLAYAVTPALARLEAVLTDELPAGQVARFDTSEFMRLDLRGRFDLYATAMGAGGATPWLDADGIRQLEAGALSEFAPYVTATPDPEPAAGAGDPTPPAPAVPDREGARADA